MDMVNIMASTAQPASSNAAVKNDASCAKQTGKNSAFGDGGKGKNFDELLGQASQAMEADGQQQELTEDAQPVIAALQAAVWVQLQSVSQMEPAMGDLSGQFAGAAADNASAQQAAMIPGEEISPEAVKTEAAPQFAQLLQSGLHPEVAEVKPQAQAAALANAAAQENTNQTNSLQNIMGQQTSSQNDALQSAAGKPAADNGQSLLQMLSGKNALMGNIAEMSTTAKETPSAQQPAANAAVSAESVVSIVRSDQQPASGQGNLFSGDQKESDGNQNSAAKAPELEESVGALMKKANSSAENSASQIISARPNEAASQLPDSGVQPQQAQMIGMADVRMQPSEAAQQAAKTAQPQQAQNAQYDIPQQIVEQARLIKTTEDTQMIIKLKPEHLGELSLKVTVENGVVSASFHSDNAQVRAALETSLIQLKQDLAAQGIKVDNVGVYAGMGDMLSGGQSQAGREQQSARFKNRKIDLADFEDEVEKVGAPQANKADGSGVDYRI